MRFVLPVIALLATVGVYGIVALIVRMDDLGYSLIDLNEAVNSFSDKVGRLLVRSLPVVVKGLTVIGTIALMLVSGGIFSHHLPFVHHLAETISIPSMLFEFITGLLFGLLVLALIHAGKYIRSIIRR